MTGIFAKRLAGFLLLALLAACKPGQNAGQNTGQNTPAAGAQCLTAPVFQAPELNGCSGSKRIRLTIVGDVLLHRQLQQLGYQRGFAGIWAQAAPFLAGADLAIANLEGPVAPGVDRAGRQQPDPGPVFGTGIYTGYPAFNYHPVILRDLKAAGIDLVSTANNHAMDRGSIGADLSLRELARAGIGAVGSIRSGAARDFVWRQKTALGNLSFIACSFSTNGLADPNRQVLMCYRDRAELLALVRHEAADARVAGVVVLPHWGQEYQSQPDASQQALAQALADAGALAVIGTHPHAVQPIALLEGPAGTVPIAYSTGNFIAVQDTMPARVGALALLELCEGSGRQGSGRQGLVAERIGWIAGQMEFTPQAYWLDIAPVGSTGPRGVAQRHLNRIAPGFSAQPRLCAPS